MCSSLMVEANEMDPVFDVNKQFDGKTICNTDAITICELWHMQSLCTWQFSQ